MLPPPLPGILRVWPPQLADYVPNLSPALTSRSLRGKNANGPAVASWMVEVLVVPARGHKQFMFGTPFGGAFVKWVLGFFLLRGVLKHLISSTQLSPHQRDGHPLTTVTLIRRWFGLSRDTVSWMAPH